MDPEDARLQARRLLDDHRTLDQAIETLEHWGLTAYQAERAAREAWGDLAVAKARRSGYLWAGGGLLITLGTCAMTDAGGRYLLAYGPILWGIWRVVTAENVRRQVGGE